MKKFCAHCQRQTNHKFVGSYRTGNDEYALYECQICGQPRRVKVVEAGEKKQ